MFNQLKLLLVLIFLGVLGILFFQNQEPIFLKILCADNNSQYCWYQTPNLPLAIWMGLFLILGVISSLMWQLLQNLGSPRLNKNYDNKSSFLGQEKDYSQRVVSSYSTQTFKEPNTNSPSPTSSSDWEDSRQGEDWESKQSSTSQVNPSIEKDDLMKDSSFEAKQEVPNINQSGSTYSYQFKKSQKSQDDVNNVSNHNDEIYDANYRTINTGKSGDINKNVDLDEEDEEEWI